MTQTVYRKTDPAHRKNSRDCRGDHGAEPAAAADEVELEPQRLRASAPLHPASRRSIWCLCTHASHALTVFGRQPSFANCAAQPLLGLGPGGAGPGGPGPVHWAKVQHAHCMFRLWTLPHNAKSEARQTKTMRPLFAHRVTVTVAVMVTVGRAGVLVRG